MAATAAAAFTFLAPSAYAQAQQASASTISIASQDLDDALRALARQTETQIVFDPSVVVGRTAPAVTNATTPEQALRRLLADTGLSYRATGAGTFVILAQATQSPQDLSDADESASDDDGDIVVTAQKREERLREVPQSVTAVTAEAFERIQANNLQDYVGRIPSMVAVGASPGTTTVTLRGIAAGGGTASAATYVDETPYGFSGGVVGRGNQMTPDLDPFDLARLEVLRGPQGTLYGASAMGGVLKFVTQDPTPGEFSGAARVTAESTEDGDPSSTVRAAFNIPLGDQAGLRLSGFTRNEGGYVDDVGRGIDDVNSNDTEGFRAKFILHATDDLTFRLSTAQQEFSSNGDSSVNYNSPPLFPFPGPMPESVPVPGPLNGALEQVRVQDTPTEVIYQIHNATIDWDWGWASLLSSTSYTEFEQTTIRDLTGGPFGPSFLADGFNSDKVTQELRLASPGADQGFEWLFGLFYTDEHAALVQDLTTVPPGGPATGGVSTTVDYTETAAFGTLTYHFSPQFDVSGGVRYADSESTVTLAPRGFFLFLPPGSTPSSDSVTTWSASARWRPSDETMMYTRVATGWRAGGPNLPLPPLPALYEADTLINYEIGVKTDIIDDLLRLDIAAFRIDWEDMHVNVLEPNFGIGGNGNADTATSQGVEWEATITPVDGLTMRWSGAYTNAELTADAPLVNGLPTLGPQAVDGARLPNVPEWATTLAIDYEWAAFGDVEAYVGGDVRYVGDRASGFTTPFSDPADPNGPITPPNPQVTASRVELPAYTTVDLRAGLDFERFGIEVFARNVGNDDSPLTYGGAFGASGATVPRPRTIGVSLSANF